MEQQPAAQRAEHAFQTHDEACNGGVHVPLAQDLQGVGHAAGHHAAVGQREPVGPELGQGGVLEQEGGSGALHGHHKELQQAQADTVHLRGKVVHRYNLKAEQHGAGKQDPIAGLNAAKAVFHAEQVEPAHGDDHAQPEPGTAPPPQKQPEYRHQHHIHGGQETSLGRGRVERDADLLGSGGRKQQGAAAKPRRQQMSAVGRGFGPAIGCAVPAVESIEGADGRQQHQHRQPAAPGQKGISPHAGACALGHERRAPDKGAEHQHERVFCLCVHLSRCPPLSSDRRGSNGWNRRKW